MPDQALVEQLDQVIDAVLAGARPQVADPDLAALAPIAEVLREMPAESFYARLKAELERRATMTRSTSTGSTAIVSTAPASPTAAPAAIHSITPFITVPEGAKLIKFMKHTFGAEEVSRHPHGPGEGFVAAMKIVDSDILIMGDESLRGREQPAELHVYVKDCDAVYRRALDAGAVPIPSPAVGEPADRPYGERAGFVQDPFGNCWFIATSFGPNYFPPGRRHVTPCVHSSKARAIADFVKHAFGAEMEDVHEAGGRIMHAFVRMGEATFELGEPDEERSRHGFYLYTDDVDAVYHHAVAAGAISISPPADQAYGGRMAVVQDPFGNIWLPAKQVRK
jgi:PhnB protein